MLIWVSMTPREERRREGKRKGIDVSEGDGKEKINGGFNCNCSNKYIVLLWQKKRDE